MKSIQKFIYSTLQMFFQEVWKENLVSGVVLLLFCERTSARICAWWRGSWEDGEKTDISGTHILSSEARKLLSKKIFSFQNIKTSGITNIYQKKCRFKKIYLMTCMWHQSQEKPVCIQIRLSKVLMYFLKCQMLLKIASFALTDFETFNNFLPI